MQNNGAANFKNCATSVNWKRRVAHAFSRAARGYERLAYAQQHLGEQLWLRLPQRPSNARWQVLDLGCGPGHWCVRLAEHYGPDSLIIGLDLAPGMLEVARHHQRDNICWLCADAATLPLADASIDLLFSNLAIQWCTDLNTIFAELYRVLRPGGRALINTLGPGTLQEIHHAWSTPQHCAALLPFRGRGHHLASAHQAGFPQASLATSRECFYYPDLPAVMASIKGIGAQVARPGARLSRRDLERARQRYESLREPAGLPVTYQLLTLILER